VIYVYAIGEHSDRLTAFVKRGVPEAPAPEPATLLEHDRVVFSLMERGAVLPMRFGTVVDDEGTVRSLLLERRKELKGMLARVRGRVEFGIRVDRAIPSTGREYLNGKLELERSLAPLAELAVDTRVRRRDRAYLVDVQLADAFEDRARAMKLSLTGPWPPYSFTGALDA
jgi:Gas vesicle synthesis protein GvpL/GvpF